MLVLFGICFAVLVVVIALGNSIPAWRKNQSTEGGIANHDEMMTRFVFMVPMEEDAILSTLTARNASDELRCTPEPDGKTLRISENFGADVIYTYSVQHCDGFCILRLKQMSSMFSYGSVAYLLNPFITEKLSAKPLPFQKYWT